jgi:hypothetical protein
MAVGAVSAVPVLPPHFLHMVKKEEQTERKNKGEGDLVTIGTIAAVPVLAPNLLHVVEKEEQTERKAERERER